jgi:ATP-dependent exoDNAse (exonuclease V) beta subunit
MFHSGIYSSMEETQGKFKIIRASAGSGKTYTLVLEYLALALGTSTSSYYRHILAITFTNAAAAEMKERVILRLKQLGELSPECPDSFAITLSGMTGVDLNALKIRAIAVYRHMLHHYSLISISTIDSFTHKLVRSFAKELRLNHDFSIEMDRKAFIEVLVDHCLEEIGADEELTRYLEQVAIESEEEESNWNLRGALLDFTQILFSEGSKVHLENLSKLHFEDFVKIRKKLATDISKEKEKLAALAREALGLIESNGLSDKDFWYSGSGSISFLRNCAKGEVETPGPRFIEFASRESIVGGKISAIHREIIEGIQRNLQAYCQPIIQLLNDDFVNQYKIKNRILKNVYSLGMLTRLHQVSGDIKEQTNTLLISDFQDLIHEVIKESPTPFIYERIGNRYKHILFDEFQDTSSLQWANTIPLITNSISEDYPSMLVGDGKQSIYRWRGGNAENFINLPNLSSEVGFARDEMLLKVQFKEEILSTNYRSARSVVAFNNEIYSLHDHPDELVRKVYSKHEQCASRDLDGYVKIELCNESESKIGEPELLKIKEYIDECIGLKYEPGDIAILTRKGSKEGGVVAAYLSTQGYKVVTRDSFLLREAPSVKLVIAYLKLIENIKDEAARIDWVRAIGSVRSDLDFAFVLRDYQFTTHGKGTFDLEKFIHHYFPELTSAAWNSLDIFSDVYRMLSVIKISLDVHLEFLMDAIHSKMTKSRMSLSRFLTWWEDNKDKLYVESPAQRDAIQVMTIHKSKGLQFPVVIYPRFYRMEMATKVWIQSDQSNYGLPSALIDFRPSVNYEETTNAMDVPELLLEHRLKLLDEINLAYVATTRAENRCYVLLHTSEKKAQGFDALILNKLNQSFSSGKISDTVWEIGNKMEANKMIRTNASYNSLIEWSPTVHLPETTAISQAPLTNEILRAEVVHFCLAHIRHSGDVDRVIKLAAMRISHGFNATDLQNTVMMIVQNEALSKWYGPTLNVLSQREIITASGQVYRPDRVVIFENTIDVVEFKTTQKRSEHVAQVKNYVQLLGAIEKKNVQGYLVYTNPVEVIGISMD